MLSIISKKRRLYSTDYYFFNNFSTQQKFNILNNSVGKKLSVNISEYLDEQFISLLNEFIIQYNLDYDIKSYSIDNDKINYTIMINEK